MTRHFSGVCLMLAVFGAARAPAQGTIPTMGFPAVDTRLIIAPESAKYVRKTAPTNPVIRRIWEEETQRSQLPALGQYLADVIGPRLTGSPAQERPATGSWACIGRGDSTFVVRITAPGRAGHAASHIST